MLEWLNTFVERAGFWRLATWMLIVALVAATFRIYKLDQEIGRLQRQPQQQPTPSTEPPSKPVG